MAVIVQGLGSANADENFVHGGRRLVRFDRGQIAGAYRDGGDWRAFQTNPSLGFVSFSNELISSLGSAALGVSMGMDPDGSSRAVVQTAAGSFRNYLKSVSLPSLGYLSTGALISVDCPGGATGFQTLPHPGNINIGFLVVGVQTAGGDRDIALRRTANGWASVTTIASPISSPVTSGFGPADDRAFAADIDRFANVHVVWSSLDPDEATRYKLFYAVYSETFGQWSPIEIIEDTGPSTLEQYHTKNLSLAVDWEGAVHLGGLSAASNGIRTPSYWKRLPGTPTWTTREEILPTLTTSQLDLMLGVTELPALDPPQYPFIVTVGANQDSPSSNVNLKYSERISGAWSSAQLVTTDADPQGAPGVFHGPRLINRYREGSVFSAFNPSGQDRMRVYFTTDPVLLFQDRPTPSSDLEFDGTGSTTLAGDEEPVGELEFSQVVVETIDRTLEVSSELRFDGVGQQAVNEYIFSLTHFLEFDQGAAREPLDDFLTVAQITPVPGILPLGSQDAVLSVLFQGPIPTLTRTMQLQRPDFGDRLDVDFGINVQRNRAGQLRVFARPPTEKRWVLTWSNLHRVKLIEAEDFFRVTAGSEFFYTDHEGRVWRFTLIRPEIGFETLGREPGGRFSVVLEGDLV